MEITIFFKLTVEKKQSRYFLKTSVFFLLKIAQVGMDNPGAEES